MTKKKIGELDGTPIVTGDKNYANEHEYYMTLNGDNTYQKLEQRTNGDQFRLVLGDGSGGGSTGVANGVVIQDGSIVNNASLRQATEADVAKFSVGNVAVGDNVIEINGVVPYALQFGPSGEDPLMLLLSSLILGEHSAYYAQSGQESDGVDAQFKIVMLIISDDATLLAYPHVE